jgi:hypothetical protein
MPLWIQILQGLLTPAIALAVGVIAFMQWRTAHQKVVLDLFDRRLAVYTTAREAVSRVVTSGSNDRDSDLGLLEALHASMFLFGDDVKDFLNEMYVATLNLEIANSKLEHDGATEADGQSRMAIFRQISSFYERAPAVFGRYMRMDQKRTRTPLEWLADANSRRLSYADEKQK